MWTSANPAATAQAPTAEADKTMTQQDPRFTLEEQAWREQRRESLLKPDGWTSLIGLHWLDPGTHRVGSDADNGIRTAMGPAHLGVFTVRGKQVGFVPDTVVTVEGRTYPITGGQMVDVDFALDAKYFRAGEPTAEWFLIPSTMSSPMALRISSTLPR